MSDSREKYLVGSDGESPHKIFFDWKIAKAAEWPYIDSFDENGYPVQSYKLVEGKYTTEF